jgi:hypothetical protein
VRGGIPSAPIVNLIANRFSSFPWTSFRRSVCVKKTLQIQRHESDTVSIGDSDLRFSALTSLNQAGSGTSVQMGLIGVHHCDKNWSEHNGRHKTRTRLRELGWQLRSKCIESLGLPLHWGRCLRMP